jgi:hypothetical protein
VHLKASIKPHVHQKFEIFWTNIAFTMGCPNSKNRPKKGPRLLGVKPSLCRGADALTYGCFALCRQVKRTLDILPLKGQGRIPLKYINCGVCKEKFVLSREIGFLLILWTNFCTPVKLLGPKSVAM